MKDSKKILKKIKDNKYFYSIMLIGIILLLFQMRNVVMYADDFTLKVISINGWGNIIQNQISHYLNWGGGFTPILVTSFLRLDFSVWKIFIAFNIFLIIFLTIKMFELKNDQEKSIVAVILWSCVFFLTVKVSRETLYWLDGSMAYVFTTFQIYIYIYFLITRILKNKHKKYDIVLLPLVAFAAGWSSAQTGAIAAIVPTLIILYAYIVKKIKPKFIYILSNIIGIIGFCIFYFAPGNSARMGEMGEFATLGIFEKMAYRISSIFTYMFDFQNVEFNSFPFFILLFFSLLACYGIKKTIDSKNNRKYIPLKLSTIFLTLVTIIYLCIAIKLPGIEYISTYFTNFIDLYKDGVSIIAIIQYLICFLSLISSLIICFYISKSEKEDSIIIMPTIAYLSQAVMIMAPYSEYRTEFISLIFLWIAIADVFIILLRNKTNILYLSIIPFIIYNSLIIVFIIILLLYDKNDKNYVNEYKFIIVIFAVISLLNYLDIYIKYNENRLIYEKNINIIQQNKNEETIYIYEPKNVYHGFGGLNSADYIEDSLEKIYNLKDNVNFKIINEVKE